LDLEGILAGEFMILKFQLLYLEGAEVGLVWIFFIHLFLDLDYKIMNK
jgi:hypothetical protein